jgi:hypothetical protein
LFQPLNTLGGRLRVDPDLEVTLQDEEPLELGPFSGGQSDAGKGLDLARRSHGLPFGFLIAFQVRLHSRNVHRPVVQDIVADELVHGGERRETDRSDDGVQVRIELRVALEYAQPVGELRVVLPLGFKDGGAACTHQVPEHAAG